ncbi:MAG: tetratricopeptide repeat protein [Lentimicrobium sp.]|nr:tetratricopeptide repeat protein [Lentimicrobium sp.]
MKKLIFILLLLFSGNTVSLAQNAELDSLINAEKNYLKDDTTHLMLLTKITDHFARLVDAQNCIEYSTKAIKLARKLGNQKALARNLQHLSFSHRRTAEYDLSLQELEEALNIYKELNDTLRIGVMTTSLANFYNELGEFETAIMLYNEAIETYKSIGRNDKLYDPYEGLGVTYYKIAKYKKAQDYILKALNISDSTLYDKMSSAHSKMILGAIYKCLSDNSKALDYLLEALPVFETAGSLYWVSMVKIAISEAYFNSGDTTERPLKYLFEALEIIRLQQSYGMLSSVLLTIGEYLYVIDDSTFNHFKKSDYYKKLGYAEVDQYSLALACLNESVFYNNKTGQYVLNSACFIIMAEIYNYQKNFGQALNYAKNAIIVADSTKELLSRKVALKTMSEIYEAMGRYDSAYYYYKEYIIQRDSIDNKEIRDQLARKDAEYEYSIKEKDILYQKELSDIAAANANTQLQQQLLLARTRGQEMLLKDKALEIGRKDKEMQHLAYLKKMAELDVVKLDKQDKEKQLILTKQNLNLQQLKLGKRLLERNLLIWGVALSLLSIFLIFRIYRNQRRAALKQKELNSEIRWANEELNMKNNKLAVTLEDLKQTQEQLVAIEKQKETEVIRRRISQDIHDDISSGLTRIAWLSELAREKAKSGSPSDAENALEKILASSHETVDRLGEIIWAINPDRDNLEGFFAYLRSYIVKFFEDTGFRVSLDFPEKETDLKFNPDLKRTLFLVVKEALHNAAKHSGAQNIGVACYCPDHQYRLTITDDGRGFDAEAMKLKGNGLKNMQKRMESVGGKIEIESRPDQGTAVHLSGEVYN